MAKFIDETGNTYKTYKVIGPDLNNKSKRKRWLCECQSCKDIISVYGSNLRQNNIADCKKCKDNAFNGRKFGKLTILNFSHTSADRHKYYLCQCECGNIETIRGTFLFNGEKIQCLECQKKAKEPQYINEIGNIYGRLTVIDYYHHPTDNKNAWWLCQCECGNTTIVQGVKLRNGHTQSCGCLKSKGEETIIKLLTQNNIKYKTQVSFNDCKYKQNLKFDFGIYDDQDNLQYLIEYDGEQHFQPISYFGGEDKFQQQLIRDQIKNEFCQSQNIPLLRIPFTKLDILTINDLIINTMRGDI